MPPISALIDVLLCEMAKFSTSLFGLLLRSIRFARRLIGFVNIVQLYEVYVVA